MKLWLNEQESIEVNDSKSLANEVAVRSRSLDWMGIFALLPDPDVVLQKTGNDIAIYRQVLSDAHVFSCYLSRKSGALSREWRISEAAKGPAGPNKAALSLIADMMARLDVYQIITDMLEAPFFGMSPVEVVWRATGSAWLPEKVEGKPPEWFAFDADNHLRFLSIDDMIMGEKIPDMKFLLPRHHASYQNPYGKRILSRCFWPVVFKKGGFKFWAIFAEKYGMPWLIGKVPRGTGDSERASLLSNLTAMVADAVAVINNDESVNITEAAGKTGSADIYERLIDISNREISKAVLGQTGSTEGTPGKLGNDTSHMEVRADLVDQDKRMVCQAFNTLFTWITELNVKGAVPPEFAFFEEDDIQKDLAMRDSALTRQGVRLTKKYYMRTYNLAEDDLSEVAVPVAKNPQFAEGDQTIHATPDMITEKALSEASMDPMIRPVRDLLDHVNSLEEFQDGLVDIYDQADDIEMGNLIAKAMTLAHLAGRFDANAE